MSAPFPLKRRAPKRRPEQIRRVTVLGKTYTEAAYRPQYAIGIICRDESDQQQLFRRVGRIASGRDLKVLVI